MILLNPKMFANSQFIARLLGKNRALFNWQTDRVNSRTAQGVWGRCAAPTGWFGGLAPQGIWFSFS
jgi:hypothetical protein